LVNPVIKKVNKIKDDTGKIRGKKVSEWIPADFVYHLLSVNRQWKISHREISCDCFILISNIQLIGTSKIEINGY